MNRNVRKRNFGHVRPTKIQISLRIRTVLSESSLGPFWIAKDEKFLHANNEDTEHGLRGCAECQKVAAKICETEQKYLNGKSVQGNV